MQQLNLDTVPRKRVHIEAEAPSAEVGAAHDGYYFLGRTKWECFAPPPCAGWWEITDHKTGALHARRWFDGEAWQLDSYGQLNSYGPEPGSNKFKHEHFKHIYAWRGLSSRPGRRRVLLTY